MLYLRAFVQTSSATFKPFRIRRFRKAPKSTAHKNPIDNLVDTDFDNISGGCVANNASEIKEFYQRHVARSIAPSRGKVSSPRDVLRSVCDRPEIALLLADANIRIESNLSTPFVVHGSDIALNQTLMACPSLAAFSLRHALELVILRNIHPESNHSASGAIAIAAFGTALSYYSQLTECEKNAIDSRALAWMRPLLGQTRSGQFWSLDDKTKCEAIAQHLDRLLALEDLDHIDRSLSVHKAIDFMAFSHPTERLLTMGGDARLRVNEHTGLNDYGCSPRPRPWAVTFSSTTASSISNYAYCCVEEFRRSLLQHAPERDTKQSYREETQIVREKLSKILRIDPSLATIFLLSSGTDAELLGMEFATPPSGSPLHNIIIGPAETGSGAVLAASGRHSNRTTPLGGAVEQGTPIAGIPVDNIQIKEIPIRDCHGKPLDQETIDTVARKALFTALENGANVLLHVLDCSKTELKAPSLQCASDVMKHGHGRVFILVDAAQMRLSRRRIKEYLQAGFMVLVTGSKFFTGPPFAAALLVPAGLRRLLAGAKPLSYGLSDYINRYDLPPEFSHLSADLSDYPNFGLLCRWHAALWEMTSFYSIPRGARFQTLVIFDKAVRAEFEKRPTLQLATVRSRVEPDTASHDDWDHQRTIYTFTLRYKTTDGTLSAPLSFEETRLVFQYLNQDISKLLPQELSDYESQLATLCCHAGQPVKITETSAGWVGGLRLSSGARVVSGVRYDPLLGATKEDRLQQQIQDMQMLLDKIELITAHWPTVSSATRSGIR